MCRQGNVMFLRHFAAISSAASALALSLMLATPAAAAASDSDMPGDAPAYPGAPLPAATMPSGPDMRPAWHGTASEPGMPDTRTRDAWLSECQRRTAFYYDGWGRRHHRRHHGDHGDRADTGPGYSYCEAYFDDYYRTYAQRGYSQAYAVPMMTYARPMVAQPVAQQAGPCEEVVTTEYVPVRTRYIPRRAAPRAMPDKRIRIAPDKRQRLD